MNKKAVTIVVPIYGDLPSLEQCIESLIKNVDARNNILLVNDCGPDANNIESRLKTLIKGNKNFYYERNPQNLGFIGTCNRAVNELDQTDNDILLLNSDTVVTEGFLEEMVDVLYASDKHGAVCPRSSNATIASVPFRYRTPKTERDTEYAWDAYTQVKDLLPRYIVTPVAVGFCILIKRNLIKNFGLFDPTYGLGYSEENDFCLRINKYGFSSVMANHAFVYHLESKSFTSEKKKILVEQNEQKMMKKYPYYRELVERYIDQYMDPVDWFTDVIISNNENKKVLISLYHLPLSFNGTSRNALSFLSYLQKANLKGVNVTILAQDEAIAYHGLDKLGFRTVNPTEVMQETFHIGYVPSQIFHYEHLQLLNKTCLKVIISDLDIISIRSSKLLSENFVNRSIFIDSFRLADKVVTISDFTKKDTLDYFGEVIAGWKDKFVTIHQGFPGNTFDQNDNDYGIDAHTIPEEILKGGEYILLVGNNYPHKVIKETLNTLEGYDKDIVVIGAKVKSAKGVYGLPSGSISDRYMERIFQNCKLVLFPSFYEGFGLPIAEAAKYGKPIVLSKTEVAREISDLYKAHITVTFFNVISEIPTVIDEVFSKKSPLKKEGLIRELEQYNEEVWALLMSTLEDKTQPSDLRSRWYYFSQLREYRGVFTTTKIGIRRRILHGLRSEYPSFYTALKNLYRKFK